MINTQELLFTLERPVTLRACLSRKSTIARGTSYWRRIQTFRQGGGGVGGGVGHPDPKIRGVGLKKYFGALRASVWSKNNGGPSPGSAITSGGEY